MLADRWYCCLAPHKPLQLDAVFVEYATTDWSHPVDEVRSAIRVPVVEIDAHINDQAFSDAVLQQLDAWVADGIVNMG